MGEFDNKVAIVTGASSGIGKATAILLSRKGARVVLTGRNKKGLEDAKASCSNDTLIVEVDLANEKEIPTIIEKTISRFQRIDFLVNNAGITGGTGIVNMNLELFDKIMQVNVRAVYQLTALAVPHLIKSSGSVVNVSSIAGLNGVPGYIQYGMSKACLDQFTRCIAIELAPLKVRVNSVNPGYVKTPILNTLGLDEKVIKKIEEDSKASQVRIGEPHEVAEAIAYLLSDKASFINGVLLPVDNGRQATLK